MTRRRGMLARLAAVVRGRGRREARRPRSELVGRDLAAEYVTGVRRSRVLPLALIGALLAALCLATLRIDLIRQRYALAAAMQEEKELLEKRSLLVARVRGLRDPARLARLAARLEFRHPERVIELGADGASAESRP